MQEKGGFFDKINNAFFTVVDVALSTLEQRGWNIPEETRFLYHTAIFLAIVFFALPAILRYFCYFEAIIAVLAVLSFCAANMMPIRKLLGYYSSDEKIHGIVNRIKNNQVAIKDVAKHLHKNLLPPNLTLSIIRAYQAKGAGLPPGLTRAIIRQPQEITIFRELLKEQLNESDFSLLMRKYRNTVPKEMLLKTVASQKMNALTIHDLLFYQENSYQIINEIGEKADDAALMDFVIAEKHRYKEKMQSKNFLRNHQLGISVLGATAAAAAFTPFIAEQLLLAAAFTVAWLLVFEALYNYAVKAVYFRL